jgi:beta-glucosidase
MHAASQQPINAGDLQDPLFPLGYRLTYPTSQDAYQTIGAAYYSGQAGTRLEACADSQCGQSVGWIADGDHLSYDGVEFGPAAPTAVVTRVASGVTNASGSIEYRLDSPTGPLVATTPVASTGGWQDWTSITTQTGGTATGRHRLYLVFRSSSGDDFVNLNWFRFLS